MSTVINIIDKLAVFIFIIVHGVMSQQNCTVINKFHKLIRKFVHCEVKLKKKTQFYEVLMMVYKN